jgi:hypothetical protein
MEHLGGIRTLIDRMGIDARVLAIIKQLEAEQGSPIENPLEPGFEMVKKLRVYVDGQELLNCIAAAVLTIGASKLPADLSPSQKGRGVVAPIPMPPAAPTNGEPELAK